MKIRYKVWLENEKVIFGDGGYRLLSLIDMKGSISQAAAEMNISYRQAWGKIKKMEERYRGKLVKTQTGGEAGGGATLTGEARELIHRYKMFKDDLDRNIQILFEKYFADFKKG